MKIFHFSLVVVFLVLSISIFAEKKELTFVCEDKETFPSVMGDSAAIAADNPGATIEILRLLEKSIDVKINIKRLPWKRALEVELKNGTADGLFSASYSKEREEFGAYPTKDGKVDPSRRIYYQAYVFYRLKSSSVDYNGQELVNLKGNIGAPIGYSVVDTLKKKGYAVDENTTGTLGNFKKLALNRVGVVVSLELTGDTLLDKNPDLEKVIEKIPTPISSKPYYIMLSNQFVKANPALAEKIWDTLSDLRNKNYNELVKKYVE